nr:SWIM zinc finger family protein [Nocardioides perillae]
MPYGGELTTTCTCDGWPDPCRHALAVLTVLGWLLDVDPLVLLALRGLPRDELLVAVHAAGRGVAPGADDRADDGWDAGGVGGVGAEPDGDADVEVALDAALRAARVLAVLDEGGDPTHLL